MICTAFRSTAAGPGVKVQAVTSSSTRLLGAVERGAAAVEAGCVAWIA